MHAVNTVILAIFAISGKTEWVRTRLFTLCAKMPLSRVVPSYQDNLTLQGNFTQVNNL